MFYTALLKRTDEKTAHLKTPFSGDLETSRKVLLLDPRYHSNYSGFSPLPLFAFQQTLCIDAAITKDPTRPAGNTLAAFRPSARKRWDKTYCISTFHLTPTLFDADDLFVRLRHSFCIQFRCTIAHRTPPCNPLFHFLRKFLQKNARIRVFMTVYTFPAFLFNTSASMSIEKTDAAVSCSTLCISSSSNPSFCRRSNSFLGCHIG